MKALSLTASLIAAALAFATLPVSAADLDYGYVPPPDRYGQAYEDPRYRDIYGPDPRPAYSEAPRVYEQAPYGPRYADRGPVPPGYVYGGPHAERPLERDWRYGAGCLPRHEIKQRLVDDGWHQFRDLEVRGRFARVDARRSNGDLFALKVDRCSGDVVKADLVERNGIGPYASRRPPAYDRRFY